MFYARTAFFLIVGFLVPVLFAVVVGPRIFSSSVEYPNIGADLAQPYLAPGNDSSAGDSSAGDSSPGEFSAGFISGAQTLEISRGESYASIEDDRLLDPQSDKLFVVTFAVRFDELPRVGKRQSLILKYDNLSRPHSGWGVSVRRRDTSLRPEVYWVAPDGKGDWFSFEPMNLIPGNWYRFTLVAKSRHFLSFYCEELSGPSKLADTAPQSRFMGGYDLAGIPEPRSGARLNIGSTRSTSDTFSGNIGLVLIAQLPELPADRFAVGRFLEGSPATLGGKLPADSVMLWIGREGFDASRNRRPVTLNGSARWKLM